MNGECEASLQSLGAGLDVFDKTGANLSLCHFHAVSAEAHRLAGRTDEALRVIQEAESLSAANGNAFFLAEIHRLRGEMEATMGRASEAEACFLRSLEVARSQQAKSWELRTTTSLGRLWKSQHRHDEARDSLTAICDWFQEGLESTDYLEATALLDSLGQPS